jgi:hypothetical protein
MRPDDAAAAEIASGPAYMQSGSRETIRAAAGGEQMIRTTCLAATLALASGLAAASVVLAQTQIGPTAPQPASAQPTPASAPSALPSAQPQAPASNASDNQFGEPKYSVDPPPAGQSGMYLPAVVGGYAKSVAGCVVVGCDSGPQVGGAAIPASPAADASPPAEPPPPPPR